MMSLCLSPVRHGGRAVMGRGGRLNISCRLRNLAHVAFPALRSYVIITSVMGAGKKRKRETSMSLNSCCALSKCMLLMKLIAKVHAGQHGAMCVHNKSVFRLSSVHLAGFSMYVLTNFSLLQVVDY